MAAVRIVVPEPACTTAPVPLMTPPWVKVSVRLKTRVPALATSPWIEPEAPALPSWRVPALMVVPPL